MKILSFESTFYEQLTQGGRGDMLRMLRVEPFPLRISTKQLEINKLPVDYGKPSGRAIFQDKRCLIKFLSSFRLSSIDTSNQSKQKLFLALLQTAESVRVAIISDELCTHRYATLYGKFLACQFFPIMAVQAYCNFSNEISCFRKVTKIM